MRRWVGRRRAIGAAAVVVLGATGVVLGVAAPAHAAIPGHEFVSNGSGWSSSSVKSAVVTCPAGKNVIGTGWSIGTTSNDIHVAEVRPTATTVTVVAYEDQDGYTGDWSVTAEAVCADPLSGWEIVSATTVATTTAADRVMLAVCSAGKQVLGAAGEVVGGGGQVLLDGVVPYTNSVAVSGHTDGWGSTNIWNLRAYAICADPVPGHQIVLDYSGTTTADKSNTASCPAGTSALGGGAVVIPNDGKVSIRSMSPGAYAGTHFVSTYGMEDDLGWSTYWRVDAYAICATT
ncbi:hypothetical protein GCM10009682_44550 [Luedemannella flava]|uniref:Secreted protein n=1 Tax=Luedemannella flava TaxID=349316 RepID=A0ABN2MBQ0_9ACTN